MNKRNERMVAGILIGVFCAAGAAVCFYVGYHLGGYVLAACAVADFIIAFVDKR